MIVLMNVKITDHRIGYPYDNGRGPWIPRYNRFDIFKYCLASYAVLDPLVTAYHFYIRLGSEFASRQQELEQYINELFPSEKLHLTWDRNDYTRDWRKVCDDILDDDKEVIWFAGNDDHIFIDYNLDMVKAAINVLKNDSDPLSVVYYSHWPEQTRMSHYFGGTLTDDGNFVKYNWVNYDGIHMFKAARFKRYWFDADYGNDLVFRPDDLKNHYGYILPSKFYAPTREIVRHYDGYMHVGQEVINHAPCLFIPPDFFTKQMKIRIGFRDRNNDYTNFFPGAEYLYNVQQHSPADYRFIESDIPLFWQNRITEINHTYEYSKETLTKQRNDAFLTMSRLPLRCFGVDFRHQPEPPVEWYTKHFKE